jgi:hypothetical protein
MKNDLIKPLLKVGGSYLFELILSLVIGIVVSVLGLVLAIFLMSFKTTSVTLMQINLWITYLPIQTIFSVICFILAFKRAIFRALSQLTAQHGAAFFDQTLGRFVSMVESRQAGAMTDLLKAPEKLTVGFKEFLSGTENVPKWMQKVSVHYLKKLAKKVSQNGVSTSEIMSNNEFDQDKFRAWSVQKMADQFAPSWFYFALLIAAYFLAIFWVLR